MIDHPYHNRSFASIARAISIFFLVSFLMSGCTIGQPTAKEPKTLKVLAYTYQFNDFAPLYTLTHDDVELELVPLDSKIQELYREYDQKMRDDPEASVKFDVRELYETLLTGPDAPDVVIVDEGTFKYLMQKGLLASLDGYIQKDKFDLDGLAPVVLDMLRSPEDGGLYGLSPGFISTVLAYNKDRFDAMNVPYPEDGMTWDELFALSESVAGEKDGQPFYGLSMSNALGSISGEPFMLVELILKQEGKGLEITDEKTPPALDTPEREALWEKMKDLIQRNVVAPSYYERIQPKIRGMDSTMGEEALPDDAAMGVEDKLLPPEYSGPFADDDFISERTAMQLMSYYNFRQMLDLQNNKLYFGDDWSGINFSWDIATFPTSNDDSAGGILVNLSTVYAINANAQQPALAWDLIQFVHSDKVTKARQQTDTFSLFSRVAYNKKPEYDGYHIEAFWNGQPFRDLTNDPITGYMGGGADNALVERYYQAYEALRSGFQTMIKDDLSAKEALEKAQKTYDAGIDTMPGLNSQKMR